MTGVWSCVVVLVVSGLWTAESGSVYSVEGSTRDNSIKSHRKEYVKETVREKQQQQKPHGSRDAAEIIIDVIKTVLVAIQNDECMERMLCEVGSGLRHIEIIRLLLGLLEPYVPARYTHYATALKKGVWKLSNCNYRCGKISRRDEL
ncbi:uncharacterized protein [Panulirus ornatus]|uniref:uncharacterized protein isoform X2 n=1 Tax=Panulirus ornatus TaxID=150431 RepID=UPI003A89A09F